ncbi:MAG TPA: Gfo/Idh/MocA family oxidoreductase [Myxococcota bacterium]|nr:Gfo/Idh/MocA family oxidoreductase [Myxococcota bacterium]
MEARPLRIGILGAATIAPMALVRPARAVPEAQVTAVAARDPLSAARFAKRHGIARVHASYDALLADREIDAVYNPLPNGLHCVWTLRALTAGKHVLCEKPIASNADEAQQMAEAALKSERVLLEAFHWRHHPLAARMREILRAGELGEVRHVEASTCIPMLSPHNIRFRYDLAGGALMDIGSYAVNMVRWLAEAEPEVASAQAKLFAPQVDRWLRAELRFPDGRTGRVTCSLLSSTLLRLQIRVEGSRGTMRVFNPLAPHFYHRLRVDSQDGRRRERVPGDATYTHQLRHFVARVRGAPPGPTEASDAVSNMRAIDAIYRAAGLSPRGT